MFEEAKEAAEARSASSLSCKRYISFVGTSYKLVIQMSYIILKHFIHARLSVTKPR